MDPYLITTNYGLQVSDIVLLDKHFGTEIYAVNAGARKYIAKLLPLYFENVENEGLVTEYLYNRGLKVARLIKSKNGGYVIHTPDYQFTLQEYIEGTTLPINSAPEWFMEKSAEFLGRTVMLFNDFAQLPLKFGKDFFAPENASRKKRRYMDELDKAIVSDKQDIKPLWSEQIRHLERISAFNIDTSKLTYANSHGDYHIGQVIVNHNDITVIDWSSACRLPICLDIITSYVFASPNCREGAVDANGLIAYIKTFVKRFPLNEYDIEAMPYVLYFWHCMCNYRPDEYVNIAQGYKPIARLIRNMLNWLYERAEELSKELSAAFGG